MHLRAQGKDSAIAREQFKKRGLEYISLEVAPGALTKELVGLHEVLTIDEVVGSVSAPGGDGPLRGRLRELRGGLWSPKWAKVRNKTTRPEKPPPRKSGGHTSVHKLLQEARERRPGSPPSQLS